MVTTSPPPPSTTTTTATRPALAPTTSLSIGRRQGLGQSLREECLDALASARASKLSPPRWQRYAVRLFDVCVALSALIVLAPIMVVIGLIVTFTSPGAPVLVQWRLGRRGRFFPCLKFRSMHANAGDRLDWLLASDPGAAAEWAAKQKISNDPRITTVGNVLRRTNLDELPQLLNVLLGQMSIVGPRPIVLEETARYSIALPEVLSVRPGLTGLWQTSGRSDTSYDDRVALDRQFVQTRSMRRDLDICVTTLRQMFTRDANGAR